MADTAQHLRFIMRGLEFLHAGELADVFRSPAPTRLHALGDALALRDALTAIAAATGCEPAPGAWHNAQPLPSATVAQAVRNESAAALQACKEAGFPAPGVVTPLVLSTLVVVAQYINGTLREAHSSKLRNRTLRPAAKAARELAMTIQGGDDLQAAFWGEPQALSAPDLPRALANDARQPVRDLVPVLLLTFADGVERMLTSGGGSRAGRPATWDALRFGAEALHAIWAQHHHRPATMSGNVGGFVLFVEGALRLPIDANGPLARVAVAPTALVRIAREVVRDSRQLSPQTSDDHLNPP